MDFKDFDKGIIRLSGQDIQKLQRQYPGRDGGYVGLFYKKSLYTNTFTPTNEESYFNKEYVIKKLMPPIDAS